MRKPNARVKVPAKTVATASVVVTCLHIARLVMFLLFNVAAWICVLDEIQSLGWPTLAMGARWIFFAASIIPLPILLGRLYMYLRKPEWQAELSRRVPLNVLIFQLTLHLVIAGMLLAHQWQTALVTHYGMRAASSWPNALKLAPDALTQRLYFYSNAIWFTISFFGVVLSLESHSMDLAMAIFVGDFFFGVVIFRVQLTELKKQSRLHKALMNRSFFTSDSDYSELN